MYMQAIYATPGGIYATGRNPFGRDLVGYIWADSGSQGVADYAEREGMDASQLEY